MREGLRGSRARVEVVAGTTGKSRSGSRRRKSLAQIEEDEIEGGRRQRVACRVLLKTVIATGRTRRRKLRGLSHYRGRDSCAERD